MGDGLSRVGILHYSAPPVVGGVENIMRVHARLLAAAGYSTTVIAGEGEAEAMPPDVNLLRIPELSSAHPRIVELGAQLAQDILPSGFEAAVQEIERLLLPALGALDVLIVHNVFTKHFNMPLTVALHRLLETRRIGRCIAWCHDFTWTSPGSRSKVFPGYPWDLLRTRYPEATYVTISDRRRQELADLFGCTADQIRVVHSGIDAPELLGLSTEGAALAARLRMWHGDVTMIMPVRVTQAKNIELAIRVTAALKGRGIRARMVVTGPPDPHEASNLSYFESLVDLRERLRVTDEFRFVYQSGASIRQPLVLEAPVLAELMRISDALFMPSLREGFGMPVLEAGLLGLPVFCSDAVPAAAELAASEVVTFSPQASPEHIADLILEWLKPNGPVRWRHRVAADLTWERIFHRDIVPLIGRTPG